MNINSLLLTRFFAFDYGDYWIIEILVKIIMTLGN